MGQKYKETIWAYSEDLALEVGRQVACPVGLIDDQVKHIFREHSWRTWARKDRERSQLRK